MSSWAGLVSSRYSTRCLQSSSWVPLPWLWLLTKSKFSGLNRHYLALSIIYQFSEHLLWRKNITTELKRFDQFFRICRNSKKTMSPSRARTSRGPSPSGTLTTRAPSTRPSTSRRRRPSTGPGGTLRPRGSLSMLTPNEDNLKKLALRFQVTLWLL